MIRLKRGEEQAAATEGRQSVFQSGGQTKQMPARPKVTPSQPKTSKKDR
ncbi:hypothetical protein [Nocardia sp. XZ_19_369]|nr:hypothetical protein [Nocardia sp. XZ_19_369]